MEKDWQSRESAVDMPMASLIGYLIDKLEIPRLAHDYKGIIYHYTDSTGLLGILNTGRFWASNTAHLNDPTEGSYVLEEAQKILNLRTPKNENESKLFSEISAQIIQNADTNLYVVSFCKEGDLLSQWRGYGSFGSGYSLGFDMQALRPHFQIGWMFEVIYDVDVLHKTVNEIIDIYIEHLDKSGWQFANEIVAYSAHTFNFLAQAFKHHKYHQENEVRIVYRQSYTGDEDGPQKVYVAPISYRSRDSQVVSYLEMPPGPVLNFSASPKLPLKEIVFGPGVSFPQNERSLNGLLHSKGYKSVALVPSEIPIRT